MSTPFAPSMIVIHRYEVTTGKEYHFLIDQAGAVETNVPFTEKSEAQRNFNSVAYSIAVFGCFTEALPGQRNRPKNWQPTARQLNSCAELIWQLRWWAGHSLDVKGHSELGAGGTSYPDKLNPLHSCPGPFFPLAQFRGLAR